MKTIFLLVFLTAVASLETVAGVLVGPVTNAANGNVYYLLTQNRWTASEAEAGSLGGHLATIDDAAEQGWVFSTFGSYVGTDKSLWIGLREVGAEGNYEWVSGESRSYTNWVQTNRTMAAVAKAACRW